MTFEVKFNTFIPDKEWAHYSWTVLINGVDFQYRTGTGHFTPYRGNSRNKYDNTRNKKPDNSLSNSELEGWLHVPQQDEVMHCLFSDAESGHQLFSDFCGELGYDTDSIKAFSTYQACQTIADKLRTALKNEYGELKQKYLNMEL